ncbi:hypothetical protein JHW43_008770 [Diplocarpon mali]|nr:hypothetical protein JHW43_008770 [Diplocarpon mali]
MPKNPQMFLVSLTDTLPVSPVRLSICPARPGPIPIPTVGPRARAGNPSRKSKCPRSPTDGVHPTESEILAPCPGATMRRWDDETTRGGVTCDEAT